MPPSPQAGCGACSSIVPVPQHTVPACDAQSGAPWHCQLVESATGHATLAGSQVERVSALSGGSQQCFPPAQVTPFPLEVLNGQ